MLCSDDVVVFDVDNTLIKNWAVYDEAYRRTSRQILGREFIMTRNPDGSEDRTFSRMSNPEILSKRLAQLSIPVDLVDFNQFFAEFDRHAEQVAQELPPNVYPGVEEFLIGLRRARLVLLSSGPVKLQLVALRSITRYFDLSESLFLGEFESKRKALESIASDVEELRNFVCIGDAPGDMQACVMANVSARLKLGVGVVLSGLVDCAELRSAGAGLVLKDYSASSLAELKRLLIEEAL